MRERISPRTHPGALYNRTKTVSADVHRLQKDMEAATPEQLPDILKRTLEQMQTMADCIDVLCLAAARNR